VFLGYSNLHKGYKCLDISTGRLYISRDIVFDETVFPFTSLHSNAGARLRAEINLLPLSLQPFNLHNHGGHELQGPVDANPTDAVAESFLQEPDQNSAYNDESSDFFGSWHGIWSWFFSCPISAVGNLLEIGAALGSAMSSVSRWCGPIGFPRGIC
jgi:hypothetical protein